MKLTYEMILKELENGAKTAIELANIFLTSKQNVLYRLRMMLKKGLVRKERYRYARYWIHGDYIDFSYLKKN